MDQILLRYNGNQNEIISEWIKNFFNVKEIKLENCINYNEIHNIIYEKYKINNPVKALILKFICFIFLRGEIRNKKLLNFSFNVLENSDAVNHTINIVNYEMEKLCTYLDYNQTFISISKIKDYDKYSYLLILLKIITNDLCNKIGIFDCSINNCVCKKVSSIDDFKNIDLIPCNFHIRKIGNIVGRTFEEQLETIESLENLLTSYSKFLF